MSGALYDGRTSKCPAVIETPFTQGQVPIQACPEGGSLGTSTGLPMNLRKTLIRPKKIDPLFSVERPYIENMCAYSLFIGNMQHIVFFLYQNLQIDCIA